MAEEEKTLGPGDRKEQGTRDEHDEFLSWLDLDAPAESHQGPIWDTMPSEENLQMEGNERADNREQQNPFPGNERDGRPSGGHSRGLLETASHRQIQAERNSSGEQHPLHGESARTALQQAPETVAIAAANATEAAGAVVEGCFIALRDLLEEISAAGTTPIGGAHSTPSVQTLNETCGSGLLPERMSLSQNGTDGGPNGGGEGGLLNVTTGLVTVPRGQRASVLNTAPGAAAPTGSVPSYSPSIRMQIPETVPSGLREEMSRRLIDWPAVMAARGGVRGGGGGDGRARGTSAAPVTSVPASWMEGQPSSPSAESISSTQAPAQMPSGQRGGVGRGGGTVALGSDSFPGQTLSPAPGLPASRPLSLPPNVSDGAPATSLVSFAGPSRGNLLFQAKRQLSWPIATHTQHHHSPISPLATPPHFDSPPDPTMLLLPPAPSCYCSKACHCSRACQCGEACQYCNRQGPQEQDVKCVALCGGQEGQPFSAPSLHQSHEQQQQGSSQLQPQSPNVFHYQPRLQLPQQGKLQQHQNVHQQQEPAYMLSQQQVVHQAPPNFQLEQEHQQQQQEVYASQKVEKMHISLQQQLNLHAQYPQQEQQQQQQGRGSSMLIPSTTPAAAPPCSLTLQPPSHAMSMQTAPAAVKEFRPLVSPPIADTLVLAARPALPAATAVHSTASLPPPAMLPAVGLPPPIIAHAEESGMDQSGHPPGSSSRNTNTMRISSWPRERRTQLTPSRSDNSAATATDSTTAGTELPQSPDTLQCSKRMEADRVDEPRSKLKRLRLCATVEVSGSSSRLLLAAPPGRRGGRPAQLPYCGLPRAGSAQRVPPLAVHASREHSVAHALGRPAPAVQGQGMPIHSRQDPMDVVQGQAAPSQTVQAQSMSSCALKTQGVQSCAVQESGVHSPFHAVQVQDGATVASEGQHSSPDTEMSQSSFQPLEYPPHQQPVQQQLHPEYSVQQQQQQLQQTQHPVFRHQPQHLQEEHEKAQQHQQQVEQQQGDHRPAEPESELSQEILAVEDGYKRARTELARLLERQVSQQQILSNALGHIVRVQQEQQSRCTLLEQPSYQSQQQQHILLPQQHKENVEPLEQGAQPSQCKEQQQQSQQQQQDEEQQEAQQQLEAQQQQQQEEEQQKAQLQQEEQQQAQQEQLQLLQQHQQQPKQGQEGQKHEQLPVSLGTSLWLNRFQLGDSTFANIKLRRENMSDRVSILRQMVAPSMHKGDTATVLGEVVLYLRRTYALLSTLLVAPSPSLSSDSSGKNAAAALPSHPPPAVVIQPLSTPAIGGSKRKGLFLSPHIKARLQQDPEKSTMRLDRLVLVPLDMALQVAMRHDAPQGANAH